MMNKTKTIIDIVNNDLIKEKKESVNWKTSHLKASSQKRKKEWKRRLGDIWDMINKIKIHIMGVAEDMEREINRKLT